MEIQYYLLLLRKRLWLVAFTASLGLAGGMFFGLLQKPSYTATATLLLNPSSRASALGPYAVQSTLDNMVLNYREYVRTMSFARAVAEASGGQLRPGQIRRALSATADKGSQFFKISATTGDAESAKRIVDLAVQTFIRRNIAQQTEAAAQQQALMSAELDRVRTVRESLQEELDYYQREVESLRDEIERKSAVGLLSRERDEELLALRQSLSEAESRKLQALTSLADLQTGDAESAFNTAVLIDEARLPEPQRKPILALALLGLVGGLGCGVALVLGWDYLDYTIKTPDELERLLDFPMLGVIGSLERFVDVAAETDKLVCLRYPRSPVAEAYRGLRTNIQFSSPDRRITSLLVTSAGPSEGKSLTAANLALALAQAGHHVLLVDSDLRRPTLHKLFGLTNSVGLTSAIIDEEQMVEPYLRDTEQPGLRLLPAGPLPPNPAELLGSQRMDSVMSQVSALADIVVYDSPPVGTVADGLVLAPRVDAVLQVVRASTTRRDLVGRGAQAVEQVGGHVLGTILNHVSVEDMGYYYSYYYYSYYYREEEVEQPADGLEEPAGVVARNGLASQLLRRWQR
jgi:capsular exopolysaccharide synthesis family protein